MEKELKEKIYDFLLKNPFSSKQDLWEEFEGKGFGVIKSNISRCRTEFIEVLNYVKNIDLNSITLTKGIFDEFLGKRLSRNLERVQDLKREEGELRNKIKEVKRNIEDCESPIEKILYITSIRLKNRFRKEVVYTNLVPQYEIIIPDNLIIPNMPKKIRVDFKVKKKMIIIECDGKKYHNNFDKKRETKTMNQDYHRQRILQEMGFETIRFTGSEIYNNPYECLEKIEKIINKDPIIIKRNYYD